MSRIKKSLDYSQIINISDTGTPAATDNNALLMVGTNAAASSPFSTVAPIQRLVTAGAADDEAIVRLMVAADSKGQPLPQSIAGALAYGYAPKVDFILVPVDIANVVVWAGMKLTATDVIATDANQIYFRVARACGAGTAYQFHGAGTAGDTTILLDTGSGTFLKGDIFSITGKTQLYMATADIDGESLTINPPLQTSVADNTTVTIVSHRTENWQLVISRANVDSVYETGIPFAGSKTVKFSISINNLGVPKAYIDDVQILNNGAEFAALTAGINLLPMFGIKATVAAAKYLGFVGMDIETEAY